MSVRNDPDELESQGKRLENLAAEMNDAIGVFNDAAGSLEGCFGSGAIGELMETGHTEVRETALDVYAEAALGVGAAGTDLVGFAAGWRKSDEDASKDFGRIGERARG
ncbi:hypothetical protein GCM10009830_20810 [Glycomyces endophyticus]|uniref:WXG100 family type VII secretion target n=1 Tax=Glycomyces endophyticus TaxID=480996 RepID=A0ABN2GNG5_9ACTN